MSTRGRGVLILDTDGKLTVEATEEAGSKDIQLMQGIPLEQCDGVCVAIVNYVHRSGKNLIFGNASQEGDFVSDPKEALIKAADEALYKSKEMGRNRVSLSSR